MYPTVTLRYRMNPNLTVKKVRIKYIVVEEEDSRGIYKSSHVYHNYLLRDLQ